MQGDVAAVNAARLQPVEGGRIEMQTRRRRSDRSRDAAENGLIARLVLNGVGPLDVGRQGNVADRLEDLGRARSVQKLQPKEFVLPAQYPHAVATVQLDYSPGARRLAGSNMRKSVPLGQDAFDQ